MLAYSYRFATTTRLARAGFLQIHKELEEASAASGARWLATQRRVLLPLMLPALAAGFILLFIVGVREFTIPLVLYSQDNVVLSVLLWQLFQSGQPAPSAALASIIVAVVLPVIFVARRPVARARSARSEPCSTVSGARQVFRRCRGRGQGRRRRELHAWPRRNATRCSVRAAAARPRSCAASPVSSRPSRASIAIGGRVVSDRRSGIFVPVHERSIGMVFQSYAIWPHLDVFENVAYPLRVQRPRVARAEIEKRVMDVLALVGMQAMARRPATRLSGGQQQRVALARAIVRRPSLLLLDEPLSNLDARLRDAMRRELATLIRQIGITALFVTHDQVEALSLADRVAVMDQGRIVQEGAPAEIYERPNNLFVARFLGAANVLAGRVEERDCQGRARIALAGGHH